MKILGFEIKEIETHDNCIIFCFREYYIAEKIFKKLLGSGNGYQIRLRIVVNPSENYPYKLIIEFINRTKDIYDNAYRPPGSIPDDVREKQFLDNITDEELLYIAKIIYVGDVIRLDREIHLNEESVG